MHAKTFTFDRRIGFIGSYNLDPRSSKLNTEMGVFFNCPALARRLPETAERDLGRNAYRVELAGNRLVWVTREGNKQVRYDSEPETGLWKRIKVQVISWLPISGCSEHPAQNRFHASAFRFHFHAAAHRLRSRWRLIRRRRRKSMS